MANKTNERSVEQEHKEVEESIFNLRPIDFKIPTFNFDFGEEQR